MMRSMDATGTSTGLRLRGRVRAFLPKGWGDFVLQLFLFTLVDIAYELTRGLSEGSVLPAFTHARDVVSLERSLGVFTELDVQRWVLHRHWALDIADFTYFHAHFVITVVFMFWLYLRRNKYYYFVRNAVFVADGIALIGFTLFPTAPPRMLTDLGFTDTLDRYASISNYSGPVAALANPFAPPPTFGGTPNPPDVTLTSSGGSVLASERIRQALLDAKSKKIPIVVSMGSVAASGGYWVSTPADFIYAEPSTITGSIGVFGVLPSFQGTLQKLGVGVDGVKTTPLSGEPDLLKGPSPEANALIQTGIESTYRRFLAIVAASRHKSPADVDKIAQGRVWDGGTARQIGLVDGFGGMSEAIAKAAQLAKLGDERGVRYLEAPRSFRDQLLESFASDSDDTSSSEDAFAVMAGAPQQQLAAAIAEVRSILDGPTIQARCLECPAVAPAQLKPRDRSLLALIADWLS